MRAITAIAIASACALVACSDHRVDLGGPTYVPPDAANDETGDATPSDTGSIDTGATVTDTGVSITDTGTAVADTGAATDTGSTSDTGSAAADTGAADTGAADTGVDDTGTASPDADAAGD